MKFQLSKLYGKQINLHSECKISCGKLKMRKSSIRFTKYTLVFVMYCSDGMKGTIEYFAEKCPIVEI